MTYPGFIFWALLIWGIASRGPMLLYLLVGSIGVTTLAVIPPGLTGGMTIIATNVCAVALIGKLFLRRSALRWIVAAALEPAGLGLLAMFMLVAVIETVFFPRFFAGTPIILVRGIGEPTLPVGLGPSATNLTTTAYLLLSVLMVFVFAYLPQRPRYLSQILNALLIGGGILFLTGLLDMFTQAAGLQELLKPFRNATYALLVDDGFMGTKRVVGLEPEASAYGPVCLEFATALTFLRAFYPTAAGRGAAAALAAALVVMAYLSTSSTAFLGLGLFAGMYVIDYARRVFDRNAYGRKTLGPEFGAVASIFLLLTILFALDHQALATAFNLIDHFVFQKTASSSYLVRNTWNKVSWGAALATYGFGTGLGGSRASDWIIAVVSNTGFLGAALLFSFIGQALLRGNPYDKYLNGIMIALKFSLPMPLAMLALSGPSPDFGIFNAFIWGSIMGLHKMNAQMARLALRVGPPVEKPAIGLQHVAGHERTLDQNVIN